MRIYKNFRVSTNEIKRDIVEMGILVHPHSYQDKMVTHDPNFDSLELQNYIYTVTEPNLDDLDPTQPWADSEFEERIDYPSYGNPGEAWKLRPEVWAQFLEEGNRFSYTYGGRMSAQLKPLLAELRRNPDSRQLFLGVWDRCMDIGKLGGVGRIPCTIGYQFQARQGELHMTYLMRSSDFATHFQNDVYLAHKLQRWVAEMVDIPVGRFTHYIASLHLFRKDSEGVF